MVLLIYKKDTWIPIFILSFSLLYIIAYFFSGIDLISNIYLLEVCISFQFLSYFFISVLKNGVNEFFSKTFNNFILMFFMFHGGILITNVLGYKNDYFDSQMYWYYTEQTYFSIFSVIVFLNAYILMGFFSFNGVKNAPLKYEGCFFVINKYILLILSIIWIYAVYFILGISEYKDFYDNQDNIFVLIFVYFTALINISFLISILDSNGGRIPFLVFIIWGCFAFNLGVRGPVFYPIALALALLITQKKIKLNYKRLLIVSIIFLSSLSYKFLDRNDMADSGSLDPLAAVREMGGSLRPIYEVHLWLSHDLSLYLGSTYFAPFDRILNKVFNYKEQIPAILDNRLMNVAIMDRAGPYGFSIVAEAFVNFANYGVFFLGIIAGLFFKKIDSRILTASITPLFLIFAYGFFYHIRQSFVSVFGIVLIGILYLFFLRFLSLILKNVRLN